MDEKLVINRLQILSFATASGSSTGKSASEFKMDALVHDLNTALELDEVNNSSANAGSGSGAPNSTRRRVWRRRCKSTSNLCLNTGSSTTAEKKNQSQNSDGSSSSEDDTRAVIMTNDRGTSSLQLSDSEEDKIPRPASIVPKLRSKNISTPNAGGSIQTNKKLLNVADTDSVNENFSPVSRPSTKRKRKFKRMALDPDNSDLALVVDPLNTVTVKNKTGTIKRKKVRSKSACETAPKSSRNVTLKSPKRQRQVSTANVVPGKRKRSSREKSVEPDLIISQSAAPSHSMITEEPTISNDAMDCDDASRRSSSSLSSSDWEETEVPEEAIVRLREDDGEADDEQSDWPGPESGSVYGGFTDDEQDLDPSTPSLSALSIYSIPSSEMENFQSLTSTARQAYLARMKRLADCVPGREIRAGSRRLRNPQSGFTIKSSSSEQLSRFLQDPQRTELRLTVLRATDRDKIAQMAALYSLQLRSDENPNMLILAKTGKTVKVDCFIVPKTPAAKANVDVKRRRRTPPPNPTASTSNDAMLEDKSLVNNELTRRQSN